MPIEFCDGWMQFALLLDALHELEIQPALAIKQVCSYAGAHPLFGLERDNDDN